MTGGTGRVRAAVTLLLWLAFLGCVLFGLHALGGALAPPPLTDPSGLNDWLEERQPAEAAFALLRLAGLATAWYLVGAIVLDALAHLSQVPAMVRCADLFTIPAVRRLANATAGVSVAAAALTTGVGTPSARLDRSAPPSAEVISLLAHAAAPWSTAGAGPDAGSASGDDNGDQQRPPFPTLRRLPDSPGAPPPPPPARPANGSNAPPSTSPVVAPPPGHRAETAPLQPPATTRPAEPSPSTAVAPAPAQVTAPGQPEPPHSDGAAQLSRSPAVAPAPGQAAEPPLTPPPGPSSEPEPSPPPGPPLHAQPRSERPTDRWEIRPCQHFWAVAERVLAAAWQREPSDHEVDPYWRQLVAANRSILRDPDNPDLLYPGQVITVPPPPPAPPAPDRTNRGSAQPR